MGWYACYTSDLYKSYKGGGAFRMYCYIIVAMYKREWASRAQSATWMGPGLGENWVPMTFPPIGGRWMVS